MHLQLHLRVLDRPLLRQQNLASFIIMVWVKRQNKRLKTWKYIESLRDVP